jgi:hypothetical protein
MPNVVPPPPATKHVFRVTVRSTDYLYVLVEADSAIQAKKLAEYIDAMYFHADWPASDWEIVDALEANNNPGQLAQPEASNSL